MSNIVNFPTLPRATAIAPEDDADPHTTAVRMFKEAFQYARKHCGAIWTANLLRASLEIEDLNGWKGRARKMFQKDHK